MKFTDYPTCDRTWVTLCVTGDDLAPDDLSAAFGIVPSYVNVLGERRRPYSSAVNKLGGWFLSSQGLVPSADVRLHLDWLLNQLAAKHDVLRWAREQGWSPVVSCYWASVYGHGGPELTPQLIGRLAEFELSIWFDVYFLNGPPYTNDG